MVGTWCLSEVILLEGILPDWRGHGLCNQLMERQCSTTWSLASEATLLLLLLSRFSHVRLYATPWTAAHQAPPSLGFSRTLEWVAISFSNSSGLVWAYFHVSSCMYLRHLQSSWRGRGREEEENDKRNTCVLLTALLSANLLLSRDLRKL